MTNINLYKIKDVSGTISCPSLDELMSVLEILRKRNPNAKVGLNTFDGQLCIFNDSDDGYGDTIDIPEIN